jgi:uncharacterized protein with NRDE domain
MCTVVVLRETCPGLPLVIAANRDELYTRPTDGPSWQGGAIVSGVDRVSGGTWMGATEAGLVVAVTNQRTHRMPDPTKKSRGGVVRAALAADGRDAIRAMVGALRPDDYNGFNLIYGDATGVEVAYVHGGAEVELVELPTGVSVIANDRVGSAEFPRADLAAEAAVRIAGLPWPRLATELAALLSDHTMPPPERTPMPPPGSFITAETARAVQAVCIHTPLYGTRSATLAAVGDRGLAHYLVTLEAPCRSPFVNPLARGSSR